MDDSNSDDDILELPNIGVELNYPQRNFAVHPQALPDPHALRIPPPPPRGRKTGGTPVSVPLTLGTAEGPTPRGFPRQNGIQNGGAGFPQYPVPGLVPGASTVPGSSSVPDDFTQARVSRFTKGKWQSVTQDSDFLSQTQQHTALEPMDYRQYGGGMEDLRVDSPMGDSNNVGTMGRNATLGELIKDIKKPNKRRRVDEPAYDDSIEVVDLDSELPDLFTPEARARMRLSDNSNSSVDVLSDRSNSPELLGYMPPKKGRQKRSNNSKKTTGKKRGSKKKSESAMEAVNAMMALANGSHLNRAGPSGYQNLPTNSGTGELEVLRSMIRQMQSMQHQMPGYHTNESVKERETYMLLLKGLEALKKRAKHTYLLNREVKCQQHRAGGIGPRVICSVCHWPGDIQLAFLDRQIQTEMVKDFLKSPNNDVWENLIYSVFSDGRLGSNSILHLDNYGQMWRNHLSFTSNSKESSRMDILGPSTGAGPPRQIIPSSLPVSDLYEAPAFPQLHEDEEDEDNDMGVAETYSDYMPRKLNIGKKHPDQVIETASMSSVEPPDITYTLGLPEKTIEESKLSALQLESIVYASQAHEKMLMDGSRAGFLIGDGAGVGKGRTVAGVIFENWRKGRKKHIWISVSNDLKYDAERDLKDIGAEDLQVHSLSKIRYGKIKELKDGGVIFSTYSALISERSSGGGQFNSRLKQLVNWCGGKSFDGCIIFDECHRAKNLYTKGKGEPTKTGWTVLNIQNMLPNARVVYASATGASEPKDMAYMVRLGLWGDGAVFQQFGDFFQAVDKRGVGAMEIVAMDMKLRGMYIARQLSFNGVSFRIQEVPLTPAYKESYNAAVKTWVSAMHMFQQAAQLIKGTDKRKSTSMWRQFWAAHQRFFKYLCIGSKVDHVVKLSRKSVVEGKCVVIGLQSTGEARMAEQYEADAEVFEFASSAKGVLENLVEKHFPGPNISKEEREKLVYGGKKNERKPPPKKEKKAKPPPPPPPVARTPDSCEDSDSDILIISDGEVEKTEDSDSDISILSEHIEPRSNGKFENGLHFHNFQDFEEADFYADIPSSDLVLVMRLKCELLAKIDDLGKKLPPNTLDQLISELGGPQKVAEMTGRKKRVVKDASGKVVYEDRSEQDIPLEILNIKEKERFMKGEKLIAIISEAASSGISLQSDRRVQNQRRRVHMTLELPWSADRAIQQFGRTHRSNQTNGPEYVFLISELAGERRFASIVAKRLESLGALTHGDRRATTDTRDLTSFNIDNRFGRLAVEAAMAGMMGMEKPLVPPPEDYEGDFFKDCVTALTGVGLVEKENDSYRLHKDYNNLGKFLNRILGTPVNVQNSLFSYFTKTMEAIVLQAKRAGKYDLGILDISSGTDCKKVKTKVWETRHSTGKANIELHTVTVERGMAWQEALDKLSGKQDTDELDGFYLSHQVRNNKKTAILALDVATGRKKNEKSPEKKEHTVESKIFAIHRPNTGLQMKHESLDELMKKYKKTSLEDAKKFWEAQYVASVTTCSHAYWQGNCRRVSMGVECDIGTRRRTYHILCGLVLNVWAQVENVLAGSGGRNNKMQVIRVKTTDGDKLVGTLIPNNCVKIMAQVLDQNSENVFERTFDVEDLSLLETSQQNIGEIVIDGSEEESDDEEKVSTNLSQIYMQNQKENLFKSEVKSETTENHNNSSVNNSYMNVSISEQSDNRNEIMKSSTFSIHKHLKREQNGDSLNSDVNLEEIGNKHFGEAPESSTPKKINFYQDLKFNSSWDNDKNESSSENEFIIDEEFENEISSEKGNIAEEINGEQKYLYEENGYERNFDGENSFADKQDI